MDPLPDEMAANLDQTDWFPEPSPAADGSSEPLDSDDAPAADLAEALPDIVRNLTESRVGQIWRPQDERELQEQMRFFAALLLPALK
jgi:hypothetical protein